jgi:hypothetical protein
MAKTVVVSKQQQPFHERFEINRDIFIVTTAAGKKHDSKEDPPLNLCLFLYCKAFWIPNSGSKEEE